VSDRLERLAKLRALVAAHEGRARCPVCSDETGTGASVCEWMARARQAIETVERQTDDEPVVTPTPEKKRAPRPGEKGYLGMRKAPGLPRKVWHPVSQRNRKKFFENREAWPRFRETAGIDGRMTFSVAKRRAGVHQFTLCHIINGMTDTRVSTALFICERLGCTINGFAKGIKQAWEIAERRFATEQAIKEAQGE
jgi:hypothetical protein